MAALQSQADAVASLVSRLLRPLIDQRLSVVFYDLTILRAEGLSTSLQLAKPTTKNIPD